MKRFLSLCVILLSSCAGPGSVSSEDLVLEVEVHSGAWSRMNEVVSVQIPEAFDRPFVIETTDNREMPLVSQSGGDGRLFWILSGETPARSTRTFRIGNGGVAEKSTVPMTLRDETNRHLEIRHGDALPLLRYQTGEVSSPDPETRRAPARNAYIHPVWTPQGIVVTEDFGVDHAHHRGIWFAWTNTEFKGRTPDFWNIHNGTGSIRYRNTNATYEGPIFAGFEVEQDFVDVSGEQEERVLEEVWSVKAYRSGGPQEGFFIFDLDSRQVCAGNEPLHLPTYHYGGMSFRGTSAWDPSDIAFLTSDGKTRENGNETRADWVRIQGSIEGKPAGILILSHPDNYRAPQPIRIHSRMNYFVFAPQQLGPMSISPGESYISRYRYIVFDGLLEQEDIEVFWRNYSSPSRVELKPSS